LKLNGTSDGVKNAQDAAAKTSNFWNFESATISNSQLDFAISKDGLWVTNPNPAVGYMFARVRSTVPSQLYFLPLVVGKYTQDVGAGAIAAQVPVTSFTRGLGPFTVVAPDPKKPEFGLEVGKQYDIQWPHYNGGSAKCSPLNPDACFNRLPCTDEPFSSRVAVVQDWGPSINGYWGGNAASTIYQEVLDLIQLQTVTIDQTIFLTAGDKAAEAKALDDRVNSDRDPLDNSVLDYLKNPHNGLRLMPLPVVEPTPPPPGTSGPGATYVRGYGVFLLLSNGTPSNYYEASTGNEPYCAVYAGCYVKGSTDPGACDPKKVSDDGEPGAYRVTLVR